MRKNRLAVAILLVMTMLLGIMTTAFAADYTPVDPDDQGKTGIVGGDTLTFTEDTVWANLTARWGVRVIFRDGDEWNNAELKSELIPVTDSAAGNTTAPDDPSHDGWKFIGWERVDTNNGSSTLNDDGTVTGINGPGPIIYQAVYEPVPPKTSDPDTPKTGDDSNIALWISLLLASFIGMMACIVLFRKKRAGKHMKTFMMLLLVGVMAFSCFGVTSAFAAEDGTTGYTYGKYDMTYLPGTTDNVTNMSANETGLTPGNDSPYTVSSTVPVREGFEFIDWTLTWGTMEKPATYRVTYVVNPDPKYGTPEDSVTPEDENNPYEYMAQVTVKDDLMTQQTYAVVGGEQVGGAWGFAWDKENFQITEDTTITGSWRFLPDDPNH